MAKPKILPEAAVKCWSVLQVLQETLYPAEFIRWDFNEYCVQMKNLLMVRDNSHFAQEIGT